MAAIDDSRLCYLMETNATPTDPECMLVKRQIHDCDAEVANIDEQIRMLRRNLNELLQQRERERRRSAALKRVIQCIRRIPPEILCHIFLLGLPDTIVPHPEHHPLIYGHVCSLWRAVSHSMPRLWATLPLTINRILLPHRLICLVKEWLHRAHPCSVNVTLLCSRFTQGNLLLEHAVLPFSAHLDRLTLALPSNQLQPLLNLPNGFPLLEVLDLDDQVGNWGALSPLSFIESPRLRTVILRSHTLLQNDIVIFPWQQVTELTLEFALATDMIVMLLFMIPGLEKLTVRGYHHGIPASMDFTHTSLISLCITSYDPNGTSIARLLEALTLPTLRHFSSQGPMELAPLIDLYDRSGFSLEKLSLVKLLGTSSQSLVSFLHHLPTLTNIHLYHISTDKILLDAFCYHHLDNKVLPRLEVLGINDKHTPLGLQDYLDMIRSRWWPDQHVKSDIGHSGVRRLKSLWATIKAPLSPEEARC